jgi:hypothetical protein
MVEIMKKIIVRILSIFAVVMLLFQLASCSSSYSADSLKSGLEKAGYTVDNNPVIVNFDPSKLDGYKSSLYGYKTVDGEENGILILIFDSTDHATKAGSTDSNVATETMIMLHDWGRKHAPDSDTSVYGTANNIVWAGSSEAKKAAGIF